MIELDFDHLYRSDIKMLDYKAISTEDSIRNAKRHEWKVKQATIEIKKALFEYLNQYSKLLYKFRTSIFEFTVESSPLLGYESEESDALNEVLLGMKNLHIDCVNTNNLQLGIMNSIERYKNIIGQIDLGNDFDNYKEFLNEFNDCNKKIIRALNKLQKYKKDYGSNKFTDIAEKAITEVINTYYKNNNIINNIITPRIKIPRNRSVWRLKGY